MTDITDQDRRDMLEWAQIAVASKDNQEHEPWVTAARYILATVDAPVPALSEELARIAENSPVWTIQNVCDELKSAAARAEQIEQERDEARAEVERLDAVAEDYARRATAALTERDEARAEVESLAEDLAGAESEVERLTAERDRIASGRYITYAEVDGKTVQKGAESNAETTDPADVKPGEAWAVNIWYGDEQYSGIAIKSAGGDWNVCRDEGTHSTYRMNEYVELIARLVPAPRVITNPDELEEQFHGTIIRDGGGDMYQKILHGWYRSGSEQVHRSDDNVIIIPVTVLWEPEA